VEDHIDNTYCTIQSCTIEQIPKYPDIIVDVLAIQPRHRNDLEGWDQAHLIGFRLNIPISNIIGVYFGNLPLDQSGLSEDQNNRSVNTYIRFKMDISIAKTITYRGGSEQYIQILTLLEKYRRDETEREKLWKQTRTEMIR
jgi:hypothetical protein